MTQGIVALDIDGTILSHNQRPSPLLSATLASMERDGWKIVFATGRTRAWSIHHLEDLPFPFFVAAFNGAILFSYPEKVKIHSIPLFLKDMYSVAPYIDRFGVFAYEMDNEERVFVAKEKYSSFLQTHIEKRKIAQNETWTSFSSLNELPAVSYASLRFFVMKHEAAFLQQAIEKSSDLSSFVMKDSFDGDVHIVQVTAQGASKGGALRYLCKKYPPLLGTIAAGDDCNDVDLLEGADIGIAVGDAPEELRKIAYTTASSPETLHLALQRARTALMQRK